MTLFVIIIKLLEKSFPLHYPMYIGKGAYLVALAFFCAKKLEITGDLSL